MTIGIQIPTVMSRKGTPMNKPKRRFASVAPFMPSCWSSMVMAVFTGVGVRGLLVPSLLCAFPCIALREIEHHRPHYKLCSPMGLAVCGRWCCRGETTDPWANLGYPVGSPSPMWLRCSRRLVVRTVGLRVRLGMWVMWVWWLGMWVWGWLSLLGQVGAWDGPLCGAWGQYKRDSVRRG